jgi:hypothetical protein
MDKLNQIKEVQHCYIGKGMRSLASEGCALPKMIGNMEQPISEETHVTTVVVDQGTVATEYFSVPPELALPKTPSDIRSFLEKDNILAVATWNVSGQPAGTNITSFDPSSALMVFGKYVNKLYGINLIRFKVEVTVKLNAYPFQQGRLLLHFLPMTQYLSAGAIATRNYSLAQTTQQPNIEIDCRDTSQMLAIPYVAPHSYLDLNTGNYTMGTFYLDVLSPLQVGGGGAQTCNVTLSYRFVDVELMAPMVPNSEEAKTTSTTGSISKGLMSARRVASSLSTIPALAAYAGPASWALEVSRGLASAYGHSKPLADYHPVNIQMDSFKYTAVGDSTDMSVPLALSKDTALSVAEDITIRSEDEMSMKYLLGVKGYINTYTWGPSTTSIISKQISPQLLNLPGSYSSGTKAAVTSSGPPLWYLSNFFGQWRGSIKIHLKLIKTDYHTGRLIVTWSPGTNVTAAPADTTYSLRHYIDIRECSEIEFTLPFLVSQTWLTKSQNMGWFNVQVQNELRAPETCNSSIQILMYACAGDDFEFSQPIGFLNTNPVLMIGNSDAPPPAKSVLLKEVIGGEKVPRMTLAADMMCVGEHISSIRQVMNRNQLVYATWTNTTGATSVSPWFWGATTTGSGAITSTAPGGDCISNFALMYAFFRGGMRTGFYNNVTLQVFATLVKNQGTSYIGNGTNNTPDWRTPTSTSFSGSTGGIYLRSSGENFNMWLVPYYNDERVSIVDFSVTNSFATIDPSYPTTALNIIGFGNQNIGLMRSIAEDFQLAYFVGCPPLLLSLS